MFVREYMVTQLITISPDASFFDAVRLMRINHIRRLPVVKGGKLVGLVTEAHFRELGAKEGSASYRYYLVSKEILSRIMIKNVITVTPDTTIEECAALASKHNIGTFPVVVKGNIVGIITSTDLFKILTNVLGFNKQGTRIRVIGDYEDKPLSEVPKLVFQHGAPLQSMFPIFNAEGNKTDLILHLGIDDPQETINYLETQGYTLEIIPH
ncbi:CBS domain-containing protein [Chloroflexota bacterium]